MTVGGTDVQSRRTAPPEGPRTADTVPDLHLPELWDHVRRVAKIIAIAVVAISAAVFVGLSIQKPTFEATTSLVAINPANVGSVRDTLVTSPSIPSGTLEEALYGSTVMRAVIGGIETAANLPPAARDALLVKLRLDQQERKFRTVRLDPQMDFNGNGLYVLRTRGPTPQAATVLADVTAQALLDWDQGRALSGVRRAEQNLGAQLAEVERQLARQDLGDTDRQTLLSSRALLQQKLAQAGVQAEGVTGLLDQVAPASTPLQPVAPRPVRNALLAGVLTALVGVAVAALGGAARRPVTSPDTLARMGVPVLGVIPGARRGRAASDPDDLGLRDALGFLGVALQMGPRSGPGQRVLLTAPRGADGAGDLTAALARHLAAQGRRVLVIDANTRRDPRRNVWSVHPHGDHGVPASASTFPEALVRPDVARFQGAAAGVTLLPAGPAGTDTLALLGRADVARALATWSADHDVVLVDAPSLLDAADALVLGRHVDGTVLVVEAGRTRLRDVVAALRHSSAARVPVLGVVLRTAPLPARRTRGGTRPALGPQG